jgi:hypothetical protein
MDGVKLIECKLTPEEWQIIETTRKKAIEFGSLQFTLYYLRSKVIRVETERLKESIMLSDE